MSQTRIFVSSTCYDLVHIRQTLNQRLIDLGHLPVMSEFSSFSIDPTLSPLENCRKNVRDNADVFVLIIGGRRGSVDQELGKSIVNIEYEVASQAGLDIYVFVDKAVLVLLPIWKSNPDTIFSPVVDSSEVLRFIEQVRAEQRWTFPFASESDISQVLAVQLSGQLRDLLAKRRSGHLDFIETFKGEVPTALSLVQSRQPFWEYLLTAELFESRFRTSRKQFQNIQAGRVLGSHKILSGHSFMDWVRSKFTEALCAVQKMTYLLERDVAASWGPPGISGNPIAILETAREFESILDALIQLESDVYRTQGPDATRPIRSVLLGMTDEVFTAIENFPSMLRQGVETARRHIGDEPLVFPIDLKFTFSKADQFAAACLITEAEMKPEDW